MADTSAPGTDPVRDPATLAGHDTQPSEALRAGHGKSPTAARPLQGLFEAGLPFPPSQLAAPGSTAEPAAQVRRPRGTATRVVLPLCLFVLLIGGIAWLTQYLSSPFGQTSVSAAPDKKASPIRFTRVTTVDNDPKNAYVTEFERGIEGHHDFLFENVTDKEAELGLLWKKCNCARLETCLLGSQEADALLDLEKQANSVPIAESEAKIAEAREALRQLAAGLGKRFEDMGQSDAKGVKVPPRAAGVLRLVWRSRATDEARKELGAHLWIQPEGGHTKDRLYVDLKPVIALVPPVRLYPEKANVGILGPRGQATETFVYWTSTRDSLDVALSGKPDPCLSCEIKKLGPAQCKRLEQRLREGSFQTKVRSAYQLMVTVYEENGTNHLDMGAMFLPVPMQVTADGERIDVHSPVLYGRVRSEIDIVGTSPDGKIDLDKFKTREGTTRTVRLLAPAETALSVQWKPPFLDVKLTAKETLEGQTSWVMAVSALPGSIEGELPADTVIVLQAAQAGRPPRGLRIHVVGAAARD